MLNYSLKVRSGTQLRTNPISGTEVRVNPSRALRPMASATSPSSTNSETHSAESTALIEMDHIAISKFNLETIKALLVTGVTEEELNTLFPFYQINSTANNNQPQPLFQLYSKESKFKGTSLPEPLQTLIENSFNTNPFSPVESLVKNVVQLQENILTTFREESIKVTTLTNSTDLLAFQATSSVYNYHLYTTLVEEKKNTKEDNEAKRFIIVPVKISSTTNLTTNIMALTYTPVLIPSIDDIDESFVKSCVLSPSAQLWGTFIEKGQQIDKSTETTTPIPITLPTSLRSSAFIEYGIPSEGEATLFYNKFPFAQFHSVVTLTEAPFVHLKDFTPYALRSMLSLISSFFTSIDRNYSKTIVAEDINYSIEIVSKDNDTEGNKDVYNVSTQSQSLSTLLANHPNTTPLFPTVVWNYLPSSAGSLIHPHWQCYLEDGGNLQLENVLKRSFNFRLQQYQSQPNLETINYSSKFNLTKAVLMYEYELYKKQLKEKENNIEPDVLDLTNPHSFIQQSRYITKVLINCECPSCNGLDVHIIAPFAPIMGNEVQIYIANLDDNATNIDLSTLTSTAINSITPSSRGHISGLTELTCPMMITAVGKAFYIVLQVYNKLKIMAYNMASLGAPTHTTRPIQDLHNDMMKLKSKQFDVLSMDHIMDFVDVNDIILAFTFVSRPLPSGLYTNDTGPLERLLHSNVIASPPESYAMTYRNLIAENGLNE